MIKETFLNSYFIYQSVVMTKVICFDFIRCFIDLCDKICQNEEDSRRHKAKSFYRCPKISYLTFQN